MTEDDTQLEDRVEQLEETIKKMLPSRREALGMGVAGLAGASLMSGTASAGSSQVGTIGSASQQVDLFVEDLEIGDTVNGASVSAANTDQILSSDGAGGLTFNNPPQSGGLGEYARIVMDSDVTASGNIWAGNSSLIFASNPGAYDSSAGEYTIQNGGVYIFSFSMNQVGADSFITVFIRENGGFNHGFDFILNTGEFGFFNVDNTDIYEFSAGDVINVHSSSTHQWTSDGVGGQTKTGWSLLQII